MFDVSIKSNFPPYHSILGLQIKNIDTKMKNQVDIGSAQNVKSPKSLTVTQKTAARHGVPNKENKLQSLIILMLENILLKSMEFDVLRIILVLF